MFRLIGFFYHKYCIFSKKKEIVKCKKSAMKSRTIARTIFNLIPFFVFSVNRNSIQNLCEVQVIAIKQFYKRSKSQLDSKLF